MTELEAYQNPYEFAGDAGFPDTSNAKILPWSGRIASDTAEAGIAGSLPPTWGSEEDTDYQRVTGWQTVCNVLEEPEVYLSAALWDGRLWLKLTDREETPTVPRGTFVPRERNDKALMQPAFVSDAFIDQGQGTPQGWQIIGRDDALAAVTRKDGAWRTDIDIAPLCTFTTEKTEQRGRVITLWIVAADGCISFHRTAAELGYTAGFKDCPGSDWMQRNSLTATGREDLTKEEWVALSPLTAQSPWGDEPYTQPQEPVAGFRPSQGRGSTFGRVLTDSETDSCAGAIPPSLRLYAGRHLLTEKWGVDARLETPYIDETGQYTYPDFSFNYFNGEGLLDWTKSLYKKGWKHVNWSVGLATMGATVEALPPSDTYIIWRMPKLAKYDPESADGRGYHPSGDLLGDLAVKQGTRDSVSVKDDTINAANCAESWAEKNWGSYANGPMVLTSRLITFPNGGELALIIGGSWINDVLITESCYGVGRVIF